MLLVIIKKFSSSCQDPGLTNSIAFQVVRALRFLQKGSETYVDKWQAVSIPRGTLQVCQLLFAGSSFCVFFFSRDIILNYFMVLNLECFVCCIAVNNIDIKFPFN